MLFRRAKGLAETADLYPNPEIPEGRTSGKTVTGSSGLSIRKRRSALSNRASSDLRKRTPEIGKAENRRFRFSRQSVFSLTLLHSFIQSGYARAITLATPSPYRQMTGS